MVYFARQSRFVCFFLKAKGFGFIVNSAFALNPSFARKQHTSKQLSWQPKSSARNQLFSPDCTDRSLSVSPQNKAHVAFECFVVSCVYQLVATQKKCTLKMSRKIVPSSSCNMPCGYANCSAMAHFFVFYKQFCKT